ncbi:MAG: TIGR03905 family TSCPD domain-containing protein [Clostridia bacterium]|nr:TIGR03905 family TSCPD domain-containing protein [Clostridia bacterium]
MEHISYSPRGVCSRHIDIDVENDIIRSVTFTGGCSGNTQGVARLLVGMTVAEAIERLSGIRCGAKTSSCPDQVAEALRHYMEEKNAG